MVVWERLGTAASDDEEAARYDALVGREVLAAHARRDIDETVWFDDAAHEVADSRLVDHGRVALLVLERGRAAVRLCDVTGDPLEGDADRIPHTRLECADGTRELGRLRCDVVRGARVDPRHADHCPPDGVGLSRDDVLQVPDDLRGGDERIGGLVGHRRVAASPLHGDPERVGGGHERACRHADPPGLDIGEDVRADDGVHTVERTCGDELSRAAGRQLLGVLEEESHLTGQLASSRGKRLRDGQEPGGVHVVPTRVHHAVTRRGEVDAARLVDGQRVHVCAQRQHRPVTTAQPRDHARRRRTRDLEPADRVQLPLDERRRLDLLERQLGVRVQVAAPRDRLRDGNGDGHVSEASQPDR